MGRPLSKSRGQNKPALSRVGTRIFSCQQHVPPSSFILLLVDNCQMFVIFVEDLWSKTGLALSHPENSIEIQHFNEPKNKKTQLRGFCGHSFHFSDTNLICHMFFMASASQIQFFYFLCNYHTHHKPTTGENTRIDIPTSSFVYLERANLFGFPSIATTDVNRVLRGRSSLLSVQLVRLDDK